MTSLAFASIIFAFIVSLTAVVYGVLGQPTVNRRHTQHLSTIHREPVQNVSIAFEMNTPALSSVTMDLHNVRRTGRIQRRFNVIAMLASREVAQDSIEWATAKDAITCKYSVNPLAMSRRAKFGFDTVFEGAACVVRCQDLMSDYDVNQAIANW